MISPTGMDILGLLIMMETTRLTNFSPVGKLWLGLANLAVILACFCNLPDQVACYTTFLPVGGGGHLW